MNTNKDEKKKLSDEELKEVTGGKGGGYRKTSGEPWWRF